MCLCAPQASVPFSRLMRLNKPELSWAILGCCASGVLGAQMPAFAIALSSVITVFYETNVRWGTVGARRAVSGCRAQCQFPTRIASVVSRLLQALS